MEREGEIPDENSCLPSSFSRFILLQPNKLGFFPLIAAGWKLFCRAIFLADFVVSLVWVGPLSIFSNLIEGFGVGVLY